MKQKVQIPEYPAEDKRQQWAEAAVVTVCVLMAYCVIWAFTGNGPFKPSTYNSYALQASRWLQGHLDLGQNYSYLEIAEYGGKYFVSFPPIPSVLLLPFCLFFGAQPPDTLVAVVMGLAGAVCALKIARLLGQQGASAVFWALFVTIGSNFLHIGYSADVWYFAQTCSFTFTMLALYYALTPDHKTGWLPCFFLALAFGCRPLQIVYLPFMIYLLWKKGKQNGKSVPDMLRQSWWWVLPPLAVGVLLMGLNFARFGNVFQFGHDYLPEFAAEKANGQFSLAYLPQNMGYLWRLPKFQNGAVQFPLFNGSAFWLYSPMVVTFALAVFENAKKAVKNPVFLLTVVLAALHLVFLCCHATMGGWQFGNRYTVDLLPVLYVCLLLLLQDGKNRLQLFNYTLFLWGLGVNLVGTIALVNQWLQ